MNSSPLRRAKRIAAGFLAAVCTAHSTRADPPRFTWVAQASGSGFHEGSAVCKDSQGNLLVGGKLGGTATFGAFTLNSAGSSDGFIAKYSPSGSCLWAISLGGLGADEVNALAVDPSGNVYACGSFSASLPLGGASLTNAGLTDAFVVKLNAAGELQWGQRGGGTSADTANAIALDGFGNCYITGAYLNSATFSGTSLGNRGSYDVFLAKYTPAGILLWAKQAGGSSADYSRSIAVSPSACFVAGYFQGTCTWGNTNAAVTLAATTSWEPFLARYSFVGGVDWVVKTGTQASQDDLQLVALAQDGGAFLATSRGLIRKYSASGLLDWGYSVPNGVVSAIATDASGSLLISGRFTNSVSLLGTNLPGSSFGDIFFAKYTPAGALIWAISAGSVPYGQIRSLAPDPVDKIALAGDFSATASFGGFTLTSGADADVLIARLETSSPLPPTNLALQMFPGLSITGIVGRLYRIEATDVPNTNWQALTNIVLPASPYLWFDTSAPGAPRRFYRSSLFIP